MKDAASNPADIFADGSVTLAELRTEFGIRRSKAYALMNSGRLPYTTTTGRRLIPRAAVRKLLASGLAEVATETPTT